MTQLTVQRGSVVSQPTDAPALPLEQVDAARRAAERSRPAIKQALLAFLTRQTRNSWSVLEQKAMELLLEGAEQLLWVFQKAAKRNVLVEGGKDAATRLGLADADWRERCRFLPEYHRVALGKNIPPVSYERIVLQLSLSDKGLSDKIVEEVMDRVVNYAEGLIHNGLLGFLDYHEGKCAAYCYVLRRIKVEAEEGKDQSPRLQRLPGFDQPDAPHGQRMAYLKYQERRGSAIFWTEKHLHILQKTTEVPFQQYQETMPVWAERVKESIPEWLAPHLQVLEGTIVEEQVSQQDLETKEWSLPQVKEVSHDSPAIRLGHLVLTGWSSQDLTYQGDNYRMADIGGKQYPSETKRQAQAKSHARSKTGGGSFLPIVAGLIALVFPGTWPVCIGRAVVAGLLTAVFTSRKN